VSADSSPRMYKTGDKVTLPSGQKVIITEVTDESTDPDDHSAQSTHAVAKASAAQARAQARERERRRRTGDAEPEHPLVKMARAWDGPSNSGNPSTPITQQP
jgi:hypothetical protein